MVLVCNKIFGFDALLSFRRAKGNQLSDTHAGYSGCLPVLECLVPGTDEQGTLEEGTGTTKRADAHGERRQRTPQDHDKSHDKKP